MIESKNQADIDTLRKLQNGSGYDFFYVDNIKKIYCKIFYEPNYTCKDTVSSVSKKAGNINKKHILSKNNRPLITIKCKIYLNRNINS